MNENGAFHELVLMRNSLSHQRFLQSNKQMYDCITWSSNVAAKSCVYRTCISQFFATDKIVTYCCDGSSETVVAISMLNKVDGLLFCVQRKIDTVSSFSSFSLELTHNFFKLFFFLLFEMQICKCAYLLCHCMRATFSHLAFFSSIVIQIQPVTTNMLILSYIRW